MNTDTNVIDPLPEKPPAGGGSVKKKQLSEAKMKEICDRVLSHLAAKGSYTNPALSLSALSVETGISARYISAAINGRLHKTFFDLINEMRIAEAKNRLRSLDRNLTIESIAGSCGFRSRSAFFAAFRKVEGKTPGQWMNNAMPVNKS